MTTKFRVSLYYKLFLIYGVTFLIIIQLVGDYMNRPFEIDDLPEMFLQLGVSVIILFANALLVRRILRPLNELQDLSSRFAKGDFNSRSPIQTSDEIGDLATAMNAMADRIQAQLESLKHMAIGVSHEIRSPLARMRLATELIPEGEPRRVLESNIRSVDELTGAILEREALNSGLSELVKSEFDLAGLIDDLCSYYQSTEGPIERSLEKESIQIHADRRRMEMALKNLVDNAFAYRAGSSSIKIYVRVEADRAEVEVVNSASVQKSAGNFGIGLSLTESIARAHGGSLSLNQENGKVAALLRIPLT
ncbi:MAG: sensor histidine kinase [Bdellovibrionales bacterium]